MLYTQGSMTHAQDIYEWDSSLLPSGVRVTGQYSLEQLEAILSNPESGLPTIGIPFRFEHDQIQSGGMLSKHVEDCLVLKNADHPTDYFTFVFTARTVGNMTTFTIYRAGQSTRSGQKNAQEMRRASSNLFAKALGAVSRVDDQGLAEEYDYYSMVAGTIRACLGV